MKRSYLRNRAEAPISTSPHQKPTGSVWTYDLEDYTPAVILMTDGQSSDYSMEFERGLPEYGFIIPIFSITFGDADPEQLEGLAELTDGRVFDGTEDLTAAFRSVKDTIKDITGKDFYT